jgi:hypothetical protein
MTKIAALVGAFAALAVLAVPALAVDSGAGALSTANLIQNPGAEAGPGSKNYGIVPVPAWQKSASFTALQYLPRVLDIPSSEQSAEWSGGANYFSAGDAASSSASQVVDVSAQAAKIDAGIVAAKLGALIGGSRAQEDRGAVDAAFLDASGGELGKIALGSPTREERKMVTSMLSRATTGNVPAKTRSIRVTMSATRVTGSYVDVFFDNLSLTLSERPLQATLSASRTCGAKPGVVASVRPGAGTSITSVAFSVGGKRTIDTSAPFSVKAPVAGKPKKIAVAAVATDSAGRTATLKKSVKGC